MFYHLIYNLVASNVEWEKIKTAKSAARQKIPIKVLNILNVSLVLVLTMDIKSRTINLSGIMLLLHWKSGSTFRFNFFWQFKIWPSFTFGTLHYFSCWTASIFQVFLSSILMCPAPLQPIPVEVMSLKIIAAFFCCGQQMVTKGQSVLNKRSEEIWWTKKLLPRVWTKFTKYKIICPIPSAKQEI